MKARTDTPSIAANWSARARSIARPLGSVVATVILLVILASVLAWGSLLAAKRGSDVAHWYVYHTRWFVGLWCLLGVNILAAALARFPWKNRDVGILVAQAGLLMLLAGSILTFWRGVSGQVMLTERETARSFLVPGRSQITAYWVGRPDEAPYEFTFEGGPDDWPEERSLNVGQVDGMGLRVLRYLRHGRAVEQWVRDPKNAGGPAMKLRLEGPQGERVGELWMADDALGDEVTVGPLVARLYRARSAAMLADFQSPPAHDLPPSGLLIAYCGEDAERISVADRLGQKIELGNTGYCVEITRYLPDARPDAHGNFETRDEEPKNPLLEIKVYAPGQTEPLRQIAFAKRPLLNLDGVRGSLCPVQFRYYHPAVRPPLGAEFMQAPDGNLYCRVMGGSGGDAPQQVHAGDQIKTAAGFVFHLQDYLSHAIQTVHFEPATNDAGDGPADAAAEVELAYGGVTYELWLQRDNPQYQTRTVTTPQGVVAATFGPAREPLGFGLQLANVQQTTNPGHVGTAAISTTVRILDVDSGTEDQRRIATNEPLHVGKFTLYQSGFRDAGHGQEASLLSVAYDPGRIWKYLGSCLICVGIAAMFTMGVYIFGQAPQAEGRPGDVESPGITRAGPHGGCPAQLDEDCVSIPPAAA